MQERVYVRVRDEHKGKGRTGEDKKKKSEHNTVL